MPSQRLLDDLDPTNSRDINDVRQEVWGIMADFRKLLRSKNQDHEGMTLPEILDLNFKFHHIHFKFEDWSGVDWACNCVTSLSHCICPHTALVGMDFSPKLKIPGSLDETIPSNRKQALKRGIAGTKRKQYLAAKAMETKKKFVKSKKLRVVGPSVSVFVFLTLFIVP